LLRTRKGFAARLVAGRLFWRTARSLLFCCRVRRAQGGAVRRGCRARIGKTTGKGQVSEELQRDTRTRIAMRRGCREITGKGQVR